MPCTRLYGGGTGPPRATEAGMTRLIGRNPTTSRARSLVRPAPMWPETGRFKQLQGSTGRFGQKTAELCICGRARLIRRGRHGLLGAQGVGLLGAQARLIRRTKRANILTYQALEDCLTS